MPLRKNKLNAPIRSVGMRPLLPILVASLVATISMPAWAEKSDRDKPVNIESDRMNADDAKKTAVFDGRVILTQGTLTIRGDRIMVTQDAQGFQTGTASGNPASFRQKRDGSSEYIEAEADRIEYNGKADRVEFFGRARLRRDCGDDVRGNYISYDARTEFFTVNSAASAAAKGAAQERVSAVLMPKNPAVADGTAPCPALRSAAESRRN